MKYYLITFEARNKSGGTLTENSIFEGTTPGLWLIEAQALNPDIHVVLLNAVEISHSDYCHLKENA